MLPLKSNSIILLHHCTMSLSTVLSWWFLVTSSNHTHLGFHIKCPVFWSYFNQTWIFSTLFHRHPQDPISQQKKKWDPKADKRRQTDGQTWQIIGTFQEYANAPTKWRNHTPVQCWAELDSFKIKKENWLELPACHTLVQIYLLGIGLKKPVWHS